MVDLAPQAAAPAQAQAEAAPAARRCRVGGGAH
jgi:hypothetical protein